MREGLPFDPTEESPSDGILRTREPSMERHDCRPPSKPGYENRGQGLEVRLVCVDEVDSVPLAQEFPGGAPREREISSMGSARRRDFVEFRWVRGTEEQLARAIGHYPNYLEAGPHRMRRERADDRLLFVALQA